MALYTAAAAVATRHRSIILGLLEFCAKFFEILRKGCADSARRFCQIMREFCAEINDKLYAI